MGHVCRPARQHDTLLLPEFSRRNDVQATVCKCAGKASWSPAGIDRGWPHQVVLPARISERGSGYNQINEFWVVSQFEFSARREGLDAAAKVTILASDAQGPPIRSGSVEMLKYRKIFLFIGTAAGCAALPTWFLFGFMEKFIRRKSEGAAA
jgi:hypothetical protein